MVGLSYETTGQKADRLDPFPDPEQPCPYCLPHTTPSSGRRGYGTEETQPASKTEGEIRSKSHPCY